MSTAAPTKRPTTKRRPRGINFVSKFNTWLELKKTADVVAAQQNDERLGLLAIIEERGEEDEKGNLWLDLPEPVEHTDAKGKTFQYTALKREKAISKPSVDVEKAEELLRKKGLWLTEAQERALLQIQNTNRYVQVSVAIDVDALDAALFSKLITPKQYDALLNEPTVTYRFKPVEA